MKNRVPWIDNAKTIGIFLVVLGHSGIPEYTVNFIYAFHMPLFFFLSGYLFQKEKFKSFKDFTWRRFKQIMVPYFFFSCITYLFWLFVGRKFGADASSVISPFTPLVGILYGTDTGNYLVHCGSLWFLPCLFVTELLCFAVVGRINSYLLPLLFLLLAYLNCQLKHIMLPWSFDVALVAAFFYLTGQLANREQVFRVNIGAYSWLLCLFTLIVLIFLSRALGRADMSSNTYPDFLLFVAAALSGIAFVWCLSYGLQLVFRSISWMNFFAMNTLSLLALHTDAESVIKGILFFVFKIPLSNFKDVLLINLVLSAGVFICLVPVIFLLNRFVPFFVGQKSRIQNV